MDILLPNNLLRITLDEITLTLCMILLNIGISREDYGKGAWKGTYNQQHVYYVFLGYSSLAKTLSALQIDHVSFLLLS